MCLTWTTGQIISQIPKILGSMMTLYRSYAKVSDRYLIDVDPWVYAIGDVVVLQSCHTTLDISERYYIIYVCYYTLEYII